LAQKKFLFFFAKLI